MEKYQTQPLGIFAKPHASRDMTLVDVSGTRELLDLVKDRPLFFPHDLDPPFAKTLWGWGRECTCDHSPEPHRYEIAVRTHHFVDRNLQQPMACLQASFVFLHDENLTQADKILRVYYSADLLSAKRKIQYLFVDRTKPNWDSYPTPPEAIVSPSERERNEYDGRFSIVFFSLCILNGSKNIQTSKVSLPRQQRRFRERQNLSTDLHVLTIKLPQGRTEVLTRENFHQREIAHHLATEENADA